MLFIKKFERLWAWMWILQLVLYLEMLAVFVNMAMLAYPNLVTARYGGWHLLIVIQWLSIFIFCRLHYPKTLIGLVNSVAVSVMAGLIGEAYFTYIWFMPYYQPWNMPGWYWGTIEFLALAGFCYVLKTWKLVIWKRILAGCIALVPLMIYWIIEYNFRVSVCICNYRLQYMNDATVNLFELLYYSIFFMFYSRAIK